MDYLNQASTDKKNCKSYFRRNVYSTVTEGIACMDTIQYGPRRKKTCLRRFANNKGADQPAHPRSLISDFVIRLL